jgi:aminoglycoside 6'-N-acetyltransferase I
MRLREGNHTSREIRIDRAAAARDFDVFEAAGERVDRCSIREAGGGMISIRRARPADAEAWLRLRSELWPHHAQGRNRADVEAYFAGKTREPIEVLLAEEPSGEIAGMAELSIRAAAEGCSGDRIAYLEGWYVAPEGRGRGIGRALVEGAEDWGREQGCTEFASDTHPEDERSAAAHRALGFTEVGLVRCFRKDL